MTKYIQFGNEEDGEILVEVEEEEIPSSKEGVVKVGIQDVILEKFMQSNDSKKGIVRILNQSGETAGTGFIVSTQLIATCAHVIKYAGAKPGSNVSCKRLVDEQKFEALVEERYWRNPASEDVAFLRVNQPFPENIPLKLGTSANIENRSFYSYGFPKQTPEEMIVNGTIQGDISNGSRLQLKSTEIAEGVSGAPVIDVTTGKVIKENELGVNSVNFSSKGQIASQNANNTFTIWNITTGNEIKTLGKNEIEIYKFIFSLDEQWLASQNADNTFTIWDVTTGKDIKTLTGHTGSVTGVIFSPDGKWLVSSSKDKTIKIWDVKDGKEINTLKGHRDPIAKISLSDDGQLLASSSWAYSSASPDSKGELILWNLKELLNLTLDDLLERGCKWICNYLKHNPNVKEENRHLCDGIGTQK